MPLVFNALLREKLLTLEQVEFIKQQKAKEPYKSVPQLLLEFRVMTLAPLTQFLKRVYGIPSTDLREDQITSDSVTALLPYGIARRFGVFPLVVRDEVLFVATADPLNLALLDDLRSVLKMRVKPVFALRDRIDACTEKHYQSEDILHCSLTDIMTETRREFFEKNGSEKTTFDIEELVAEGSPVVRLVNLIFSYAVRKKASDIHIEPQEESVRVRIRVDGHLRHLMTVPATLRSALATCIKVMTDLNIAECRKTQDGRTAILIDGRKVDVRISVSPTYYGEKIVLRLLDKNEARLHLDKIGLADTDRDVFIEAITRSQGMVLVTGPTGSGKTSSLYAGLNYVKRDDLHNIVTIEDPIEYLIDGVNQIQVNVSKNVTFANALRSILRQDPNVVLVGEIRDRDTAEIAMRSSLTGHLVLSTLHTLNAVSSVTRLMDIGLEPYLIASSLTLVVAQRLVRVICHDCKEEGEPDPRLVEKFGLYLEKLGVLSFYYGKGCRQCDQTGFRGRTAIFEMLPLNEKLRSLVAQKAPEDALFREAAKLGMKSLAEAAVEKVAHGLTTLEEINVTVELTEVERAMNLRRKEELLTGVSPLDSALFRPAAV